MQLHGLHHVTAVTGDASNNLIFYTDVLGLRLVKKSVNQDDVSAYHLFYADALGTPGWDMTFFDWPRTGPNQPGTDSIRNTMFRVNGRSALEYWRQRLAGQGVEVGEIETFAGRDVLRFADPEGQALTLVDDQGAPYEGEIWGEAGIPDEHAIRGFYGVMLSLPRLDAVQAILTDLLAFDYHGEVQGFPGAGEPVHRFTMEGGGPGKELFVLLEPDAAPARLGYGGVHHVAFRVADGIEQNAWDERLRQMGLRTSGIIDRYYFQSLYFRISRGILFELATDGPGFAADEPLETLGERLALPPFLEPHRERIEAGLTPL